MNENQTEEKELALLPLTIENLKAKNACREGMAWITPLLEANDDLVCEKLYDHRRDWFQWAIGAGFDVYSRLSEGFKAARDLLPIATSGYLANASTSGYLANASTSGYQANASTSGYRANASTSGDRANASTSGYRANASTSGGRANASTSGDRSNASTSGDRANASTSGRAAFAFVRGEGSRVRGTEGCCLIAAYYDDLYKVAHVATGTVGEDGIKANVWYLADSATGKLVRADDQSEPDWSNAE